VNIILPHVGDLDDRVAAPLRERDDVLVVEVPGEESYHELLRRCWATGMDFLVVEHDVVVNDPALDDLIACPEPWCAQPYLVAGEVQTALGCTRFRGEFTQKWPEAIDLIGEHVGKHWATLDAALTTLLGLVGVRCHAHAIEVEHLNARAGETISDETRVQIEATLRQARESR
jgi:hypothetical protein